MTNNSLDTLGTMFMEQAIEMSKVLKLFAPETPIKSASMRKARIFTAWAVFSWQAAFDYYFFRSPHLTQPPKIPLPDPRTDPRWYGDISVQYPSSGTLDLLYVGHKIHSQAALYTIVNELGSLLFGRVPTKSLSIDEITTLKRKLDAWWDTLPEAIQPKNVIYPHHLTLQ